MFKNKKIVRVVILLVICVILVFSFSFYITSQREKARREKARQEFLADLQPPEKIEIPGIKLVSHFNDAENTGNLGDFGAWDKDPNDYTQSCFDSFSSRVRFGDSGYSLRVDYDVDSPNPAFNGVWFELGGADLSEYRYMVFKVKGDEIRGFTENFKVEISNAEGEKGIYYISGIDDTWKEFVVPLRRFMGISNFDEMRELIFVFEDWRVTEKEGTLYIDDIYFAKDEVLEKPLSEIFKTARELIPKPDICKLTDKEFLELVQRKSFAYLWQETHPETGLTKDKANNFTAEDDFNVASIAAVGFALTAYPIAIEKGWITKEEGLERTLTTLKFFRDDIENVHGFFYHFVGYSDGVRVWNCELSSIDTALLIAGMLFVGEYFGGEVKEIATEIYKRVEWDWMMAGGETISMGWMPEKEQGFLTDHWNKYGEQMILYLLAMASPTYPVPVSVWDDMTRPMCEYEGYVTLASPPLFTHQYSHIWVDFRNKNDGHADYFKTSINATLANKQFCNDNRHNSLTFRNRNSWGLTACESPAGYRAYGAPPGYALYDGTVAITAPGASVPFAPKECIAALRWMYENHKENIWGKYGFVDSYNLDRGWYADVVLGIDQGAMLLMIENYLSEFIWKYFMRNKYIQKAMDLAGFRRGSMELKPDEPPVILATYRDSRDKCNRDVTIYSLIPFKHLEYGSYTSHPEDIGLDYTVEWDKENLYITANVSDNEVIANQKPENLYKQDCVEIYISPENSLFYWGHPEHFQLGFAPSGKDGEPVKYAWFQGKDIQDIKLDAEITDKGYKLDIIIPFKVLNINPEAGREIGFSIAVHDLDKEDITKECKFNLFFRPIYKAGSQRGFRIATLKLEK